MSGLITLATFIAVSHPATYKLTSKALGGWVATSDGLPKTGGLILHAFVFLFLAGFLVHLLVARKSGFQGSAPWRKFLDRIKAGKSGHNKIFVQK
jgi:fructose-specific phosphotransferase system IIC component